VNYRESLAWLYATQQFGIKLGLENVRRLLAALGWSGERQRFLHVAGTNGKGSLCAMLDAICRAQKIRTGLFTSPHLVTFRERIRIDGELIDEENVARGLSRIREIVADWEMHPTFFEIVTALALVFFQRENADVAVLETGMGGRLDATNVVTPRASIITAIDFDHQAWLGETLREIAAEKAGIIKPRVPVVSTSQKADVAEVLEKTAVKQDVKLSFVYTSLETFEIALVGSHQKLHAALAVAALREAEIHVDENAIRAGLRDVVWPGRFQKIRNPQSAIRDLIVIDGAHNPAAAARLVATWREEFGDERATIVLGILRDKNVAEICAALAPIAESFVATPVRNPRSSSAAEICASLASAAPNAHCTAAENFREAMKIAESSASAFRAAKNRSGKILICGSLFLVGEALVHFGLASAEQEISSQ